MPRFNFSTSKGYVMTQRKDGLATIKEAAAFLKIGHVSVYAMIKDHQVASVKVRNARRIPWSALYAIVDSANTDGIIDDSEESD